MVFLGLYLASVSGTNTLPKDPVPPVTRIVLPYSIESPNGIQVAQLEKKLQPSRLLSPGPYIHSETAILSIRMTAAASETESQAYIRITGRFRNHVNMIAPTMSPYNRYKYAK